MMNLCTMQLNEGFDFLKTDPKKVIGVVITGDCIQTEKQVEAIVRIDNATIKRIFSSSDNSVAEIEYESEVLQDNGEWYEGRVIVSLSNEELIIASSGAQSLLIELARTINSHEIASMYFMGSEARVLFSTT